MNGTYANINARSCARIHSTESSFERLYCCGSNQNLTDGTNGTLNETFWICQITIKKTHAHTHINKTKNTQLTHTSQINYIDWWYICFCISIVSTWIRIAYILVIIISFFCFFSNFSQCAFSCKSNTNEVHMLLKIKIQKIEKVKLVGSKLLRRQERYL